MTQFEKEIVTELKPLSAFIFTIFWSFLAFTIVTLIALFFGTGSEVSIWIFGLSGLIVVSSWCGGMVLALICASVLSQSSSIGPLLKWVMAGLLANLLIIFALAAVLLGVQGSASFFEQSFSLVGVMFGLGMFLTVLFLLHDRYFGPAE